MLQNQIRKRDRKFSIVTIAGYDYQVTLREVFSWFTNRKFYLFLFISQIVLIFALPHNNAYGLDFEDRFVFWPVMTVVYICIYLMAMLCGALYAQNGENRIYYSPFGMVFATAATTYLGSYLIGYLTQTPPDLSSFKSMEALFNLLWASLFESYHYAYNVPRLREKYHTNTHEWESVEF